MKRKIMAVMIGLAMAGMAGSAFAQQTTVVGTTVVGAAPAGSAIGVASDELVSVTNGWSAKKQIIGKDVYNDLNEKVGVVEDLIISSDKAVSFAVIGTGGFLGMDKHDVAIRMNQIKIVDGKMILQGATKDALKALPTFQYSTK